MENNNNPCYKLYLSIDWSQQDVSIARMRAGSNQPETKMFPSDIKKIKDARKLCLLLRSGLLKEVYHTSNENYKIRKLASAYIALVKAGVRIKNQNSALYRGERLKYKKDFFGKGEILLLIFFLIDSFDEGISCP